MDAQILSLGREAVILVLLTSAPPLAAALLVGVLAGVLQAATQIQEQTIGTVPRIVAAFGALGICAPWIAARVVHFAQLCLDLVPRIAP